MPMTDDGVVGDFLDWSDRPELTRGLVSRGFSDEEIQGFLRSNWRKFCAGQAHSLIPQPLASTPGRRPTPSWWVDFRSVAPARRVRVGFPRSSPRRVIFR